MKNISVRSIFIATVAIAGAIAWGIAEIISLQWSRAEERLHPNGKGRTFRQAGR